MRSGRTSCDTCAYYIYDEEYDAYLCDANMDEGRLYAASRRGAFSVSLLPERG